MKLVFCFTVAALVILSSVDVDGQCSSAVKSQRKQKAASISEGNRGKPRFTANKNKNSGRTAQAFGSAGGEGGGRGRDRVNFRRARRASSLALALKGQVDSKKTRISQAAGSSYPTQQIQSCCNQIEGYIEGFGSGNSICYIVYPYLPPSVQCNFEDCYEGYWWDNTVGICVEQNPLSHEVILYCPFEFPYYFLEFVTAYCNCGCANC